VPRKYPNVPIYAQKIIFLFYPFSFDTLRKTFRAFSTALRFFLLTLLSQAKNWNAQKEIVAYANTMRNQFLDFYELNTFFISETQSQRSQPMFVIVYFLEQKTLKKSLRIFINPIQIVLQFLKDECLNETFETLKKKQMLNIKKDFSVFILWDKHLVNFKIN
jgi:hypothetical protein